MPSPKLNAEQAQRHAEVMKGNKLAVGLKTEESKTEAFKSFCAHLSDGWSPRSWYWKDAQGNHCACDTMQKLIDNNVFPQNEWDAATAAQHGWWEKKGRDMIDGETKGNPVTFNTFVRNLLGWDAKRADYDDGRKELRLTITNKSEPLKEIEV